MSRSTQLLPHQPQPSQHWQKSIWSHPGNYCKQTSFDQLSASHYPHLLYSHLSHHPSFLTYYWLVHPFIYPTFFSTVCNNSCFVVYVFFFSFKCVTWTTLTVLSTWHELLWQFYQHDMYYSSQFYQSNLLLLTVLPEWYLVLLTVLPDWYLLLLTVLPAWHTCTTLTVLPAWHVLLLTVLPAWHTGTTLTVLPAWHVLLLTVLPAWHTCTTLTVYQHDVCYPWQFYQHDMYYSDNFTSMMCNTLTVLPAWHVLDV